LRARSGERNSWVCCSGTKLALINPQLSRSAVHVPSLIIRLAAGYVLDVRKLASISSNIPSLRIFDTGFQ
jgi:hypothetical protein